MDEFLLHFLTYNKQEKAQAEQASPVAEKWFPTSRVQAAASTSALP
jgi:hypothetical protein